MKRIKLFIIAVVVGGLIAGTASAVQADTESLVSTVSARSQDGSDTEVSELEELEELELVPVPIPGRSVSIDGGFSGIWVKENEVSVEPQGRVVGVYGRVNYANGDELGFFGGIWRDGSGRTTGYLKGKYDDGSFRGKWLCLENGVGGPVSGRCFPTPDTTDSDLRHYFYGEWETEDGQLEGYLRGTWSPIAVLEPRGRFSGQWTHDDQTAAAELLPDGRLSGAYGLVQLQDGTSMHYFRGRWNSAEGAQGRLGGLIASEGFCGLWNSSDSSARGYLKGVWGHNRFRGVWGYFGQGAEGRLWGQYGSIITPEPVAERATVLSQRMNGS
jgi:hypothetical protein